MALTGTTNTAANTALRYLAINNSSASSSLAKLSSGSRIVKASDDAASLAIGTKLKADVTALKQAAVNAGQATSLLQVADGGLARIGDILQRMKALAVQAQSGSVTDNERTFLNQEYQGLATQVTDIASQTKFNGSVLLSGGAGKTVAPAAGLATRELASISAALPPTVPGPWPIPLPAVPSRWTARPALATPTPSRSTPPLASSSRARSTSKPPA